MRLSVEAGDTPQSLAIHKQNIGATAGLHCALKRAQAGEAGKDSRAAQQEASCPGIRFSYLATASSLASCRTQYNTLSVHTKSNLHAADLDQTAAHIVASSFSWHPEVELYINY